MKKFKIQHLEDIAFVHDIEFVYFDTVEKPIKVQKIKVLCKNDDYDIELDIHFNHKNVQQYSKMQDLIKIDKFYRNKGTTNKGDGLRKLLEIFECLYHHGIIRKNTCITTECYFHSYGLMPYLAGLGFEMIECMHYIEMKNSMTNRFKKVKLNNFKRY